MMVLFPLSGVMTKMAASTLMLSPEGLGVTKQTAERRTYGRTRETGELRDRLQAETLMATERS